MRNCAQCAAWQGRAAVFGLLVSLLSGCLGMVLRPGLAWAREHESAPPPALRIPLAPLGYRPPGKLYLLAHYSSSSLDFLDATHLLFTFREPRLLQRTEHSSGLDQAIHAEVLELPSGEVTGERHWELADRQRYVWPLGEGKALLRVGSRLFEADSLLNLKTFLQAEAPLREVEVSSDGRLLMLETDAERHTTEEHARLVRHAEEIGADPPAEDVEISMLRLDERKVMLKARADHAGSVPATTEGFLTNERLQQDRWNIRFHPYEKKEQAGDIVAQIDSTCPPEEHILTDETLLALSCPPRHGDRYVAAYSLKGQKLWDGRWPSSFAWPAFRASHNGAAVAISWIVLGHSAFESDGIDDSDVQAQVLSVLDSKTGGLRMGVRLDPIMSTGSNFALSPDGSRLAVLNRGALEVYDLPVAQAAQTTQK